MGFRTEDVRYAVRALARAPGFTAVTVLTIALGLGANTAIFTVVHSLLLRPLPYPRADRLVMVWQDLTRLGGPADEWATPGNFSDWSSEPGLFQNLAAIGSWQATLTGDAEPEVLAGEQVTHEYFSVLGVSPVIGRAFAADDDAPNAARVVMIGEGLWARRFGRDAGAVGRTVMINGEPHEIVGVLPAALRPVVIGDAEVWRPLRLNLANPSRGAVVLRVVARLPDGLALAEAQTRADALARRLEAEHPGFNENVGFALQTLHERVTGNIRPTLLALTGAVGFVLLIACTNVANLLLARGSVRARELAVRAALGADRWRVVRQLLTESVVLATLGGLAGLLLASWAVDALIAMAPAGTPRVAEVALDRTVLAFTALLTFGTGLLFGLAPALQHSRFQPTHALKEGGRGMAGEGGRTLRRALISVEVALAVVLLTGGVLLIQTFSRLQSADLGFRTDDLLVGFANPPRASYDSAEKLVAFYDQLLERAAAVPGVRRAALASVLPLGPGDSDMNVYIDGRAPTDRAGEAPVTWYRLVSAGYFETIGMRLVRGHSFTPGEVTPAVVVNETFAQRYFPGDDALGRRIRFGVREGAPWFTIVGVVADARGRGPREPARVETFIPYWQFPEPGINVVLSGPNPAALAPALRQAASSVDRNVPIAGVRTMDEIFRDSLGQSRFLAMLAGGFAVLALVLAAVGIYGVMAYTVSQRRAELGIRMALGATAAGLFRLVVGDGLRLATIGIVLGTLGAILSGRWLAALLFDVAPTDPGTLTATALVLLAVAAAASVVPAWRATRVDPMVALRSE